jgi:hypothetical protein
MPRRRRCAQAAWTHARLWRLDLYVTSASPEMDNVLHSADCMAPPLRAGSLDAGLVAVTLGPLLCAARH